MVGAVNILVQIPKKAILNGLQRVKVSLGSSEFDE
jgi:hypothetical protein